MPIVQSSGAGKSRLMDHYGKTHLGVVYTLRVYDQSGYPPGDPEITELMLCSMKETGSDCRSLGYATAVGLVASTINHGEFGYLYLVAGCGN